MPRFLERLIFREYSMAVWTQKVTGWYKGFQYELQCYGDSPEDVKKRFGPDLSKLSRLRYGEMREVTRIMQIPRWNKPKGFNFTKGVFFCKVNGE